MDIRLPLVVLLAVLAAGSMEEISSGGMQLAANETAPAVPEAPTPTSEPAPTTSEPASAAPEPTPASPEPAVPPEAPQAPASAPSPIPTMPADPCLSCEFCCLEGYCASQDLCEASGFSSQWIPGLSNWIVIIVATVATVMVVSALLKCCYSKKAIPEEGGLKEKLVKADIPKVVIADPFQI